MQTKLSKGNAVVALAIILQTEQKQLQFLEFATGVMKQKQW